ncbi:hypothetical protein N657DRAFT_639333 [Parathielavia appendiculata]|uniref:Uncharacterized protein n=1 Tax=Parathielavia appendiculata TaxID=2587402 RepID=A0AAN6Z8D0_9PEZI|nr:hypothetical protein N657DRAFT_639333 [Parathielavia appendiculata]
MPRVEDQAGVGLCVLDSLTVKAALGNRGQKAEIRRPAPPSPPRGHNLLITAAE